MQQSEDQALRKWTERRWATIGVVHALFSVSCIAPKVITECVGEGCLEAPDADPRFRRDAFSLPAPDQQDLSPPQRDRALDQRSPQGEMRPPDVDMRSPFPVDMRLDDRSVDQALILLQDMSPIDQGLPRLFDPCDPLLELSCAEGNCFLDPEAVADEQPRCRSDRPTLSEGSAYLFEDTLFIRLEGADLDRDLQSIVLIARDANGETLQVEGTAAPRFPVNSSVDVITRNWILLHRLHNARPVLDQGGAVELSLQVEDAQGNLSEALSFPYPLLRPSHALNELCDPSPSDEFTGYCALDLSCVRAADGLDRCAAHVP